ncbi:hypothetical protein ANCDUO_03709 [Ancylostoma duodenale]|uniref:TauD/TfdA-like domain-containing protein n=1 Tax=Ancylostoma duodenale TaxID=51022 RepID=A0A0C2H8V2_9BILA|nr:hypothetical protein ANCDUO_03709 [Ancylostoma duodenale]
MKGRFPVIWLRDCSPDPVTYSVGPAMIARNLTMNEFDVEQSPKDVRLENDELVIDWEDTQSRFDSTWLRIRNPSDEKAADLRRRVYLFPERTWGNDEIETRLKKCDHNAVMNDDKTLHDFLEAVCMDGIAVIQNGPTGTRRAVPDIGERIGLIHNTHFGKVFEVSTKPDASNKAYASDGGLPFHTDFPSLSHPPQLQMLHMIRRAEEGGNSLFVDGFHVAEQRSVVSEYFGTCYHRNSLEHLAARSSTGPKVSLDYASIATALMFARFQARFITSAAKIASVSQPINRIITVEWTDGMKGRFPVIWLRDCSPDPVTYSVGPAMIARNLTMNEFDVEQSPKDVRLENDKLVIDWEDTQSRFDSTWLRIRNPSDEKAADHRRRVYLFPERTWGKDEIESRLKKFDHNEVMNDDKTLHDFLEAVCMDGIAVIQNGPTGTRRAVPDIGERIGLIHNTHFG